ncbi:MAG: 4Fe-4S binding protein, partial [Sedimentisphaerales bacterium]|nr:4Fe-4S binding protein [Sedimentisphaerales bacterium]
MTRNAQQRSAADAPTRRGGNRARLLVRGACLVGAVLLLWPVVPVAWAPALVGALSPFVATASLLATRAWAAMAWAGLAVGVVVLVRHRIFCRWICPMGLCLDGASRLGRRLGRRVVPGPRVGPWIVLLTLGGACLGYPLLLWLDPLALFTGVFTLGTDGPASFVSFSALLFFALLLSSLLWPNLWCARICPLGAFQDLLSFWRRFLGSVRRRLGAADDAWQNGQILSRRTAMGIATGAVVARMTGLARGKTSHPLRPPGALDESKFVGVCTRCGNCLRSCPSGIIRRDTGQGGWASLWTPVLNFQDDYCREDCTQCTQVCPSGALMRLLPEDKPRMRLGLPRVDMDI